MSMYPEASSPIGSPYTPAGGSNMGLGNTTTNPNPNPNPNQLGVGGNSGSMAPVAQQMQGMGRGEDSMLIHMTPGEVGGLQALAQSHGGSLTINPHTGLPEAGFLSKLLPTLLGFGLNFFLPGFGSAIGAALGGIGGAAGTAVGVGAGYGLAKGSLTEGLMAGLGAFGGASLGAGLTAATAAPAAAPAAAGSTVGSAAGAGAGAGGTGSLANITANAAAPGASLTPTGISSLTGAPALSGAEGVSLAGAPTSLFSTSVPTAASTISDIAAGSTGIPTSMITAGAPSSAGLSSISTAAPVATNSFNRFTQGFVNAANNGAKPSLMRTGAAAAGVGIPIAEALQPEYKEFVPEDEGFNYEGPYRASKRNMRNLGARNPNSSFERMYFEDTNPFPGFTTASGDQPSGYASGGATKTPQLKAADLEAAIQIAKDQYIPRPDDYVIGGPQEHNYGFRPMATNMPAGSGILDRGVGQTNTSPLSFRQALKNGLFDAGGSFLGFGGRLGGGSVDDYYLNPETGRMEPKVTPAAASGMHLKNGSFIVDARTVSELGNGSSRAGQDLLAKYGGQTLHGPGDGVSDSIHANIGGTQEARVARDEVKFDPEAVANLGNGNVNAGTKKLYALMAKAEKARKSAKRGQDTGLRAIMKS